MQDAIFLPASEALTVTAAFISKSWQKNKENWPLRGASCVGELLPLKSGRTPPNAFHTNPPFLFLYRSMITRIRHHGDPNGFNPLHIRRFIRHRRRWLDYKMSDIMQMRVVVREKDSGMRRCRIYSGPEHLKPRVTNFKIKSESLTLASNGHFL